MLHGLVIGASTLLLKPFLHNVKAADPIPPNVNAFPDRPGDNKFDLLTSPQNDKEYIFFQAHNKYPFKPAAKQFEHVNAAWLTDAALLAYWDEAGPNGGGARKWFTDAGLEYFRFFNGAPGVTDTQCHLAGRADPTRHDNFLIVSFRGTESRKFKDVLSDAEVALTAWEGDAFVHSGFKRALDAVWEDLARKIAELQNLVPEKTSLPVWFTGHSLGAALATLAAASALRTWKAASGGIYTIGSPRVGNMAFCEAFNTDFANRSFRYVNSEDLVTHVPPPWSGLKPPARRFALRQPSFFDHVKQPKWIDGNGVLGLPPKDRFSLKQLKERLDVAKKGVDAALAGNPSVLLDPSLIDHTPRRYAVRIWDDYFRWRLLNPNG